MRAPRAAGIVFAIAVMLGLAGCSGTASSPLGPESIITATDDGVELRMVVYPVPGQRPPSLVLLHRYGADNHVWDVFARAAQQAGYLVAAVDLRGHGRSKRRGNAALDYREMPDSAWTAALSDVRAAKQAVIRAGADPENVAICGEALGAGLALRAARLDPGFQAVIALSPGLEEKGIAAEPEIRTMRERPVLLVASEGDSYAASSAASLKQAAPGFCELRTYPGAAHGADLLAANPGAVSIILGWLETVISPPEKTKS